MSDPVIVDTNLMNAVKIYVEQHHDGLSIMLAKFFNAFVTQSVFVESYEVDNFVLRNANVLGSWYITTSWQRSMEDGADCTASAWKFYDLQIPELYCLRPHLLLHVLSVEPQPLETLFAEETSYTIPWEQRHVSSSVLGTAS